MLLEGMLMAHDRSRFELHAFSLNPTPPDDRHKKVRGHFDHFHEVSGISDSAVALLSREHEIDIAIDLKGFTMGARPGIFAERAAPIQINYLGFPGSMGASFIDYMVADHYTVTPGNRPFFSEKIIYLPHCYQPNSPHRPKPVSDSPRPSELPAGAFVYCSFNNVYKLTPTQFDLWIRVLKQTPGSVLWLLKSTEQAQINLTKRAAYAGLDPQRIIFAPLVPEAEHLQRVSFADCFLDSFPCNAHTTASDAVWAGVPLITRSGKTFASRVAGSILTTIGLPELIVEDDAAYEALALRVYNDRAYLADLKRRVEEGVQNGPLYNAELYARHFEQVLSAVYEVYHKGGSPDDLSVSDNFAVNA
jgi:predicted O-linked N-acetylglucosamine transferase (SPINDLY family)